jgi:alkylation response protein AidB-like acyl-CoA dehydrogenase
MADFGGDVETFRAEARDWLEANFPKSLAKNPMAQLAKLQAQPESPEALAWRRAMGAKGWGTPVWPKSIGGGGLSRDEARGYGQASVNVTIQARDAQSFRQSRTQVAADIARAVSLGRRGM